MHEGEGIFKKSAVRSNNKIDVSNANFSTNLFDQQMLEIDFEELRREDEEEMSEYVSKRELDSLKELMATNREHDIKLNEERMIRLEEKVASGNQLILHKIDSSNVQVVSKLESLNKDFETQITTLKTNFEHELDRRFTQERDASSAEVKESRKYLWALLIPALLSVVQIALEFK
ncbi:hypothetical protein L479_02833 [Exiguobacterium sp. S17]|nr:hypothetical protein L479_02833 [Exiguobacterium sp. S17]